MGKRKLHETTYFQCDFTGFPMDQSYCYMPSFSAAGKLQKRGSYCNWEAVVSHAYQLRSSGAMQEEEFEKVLEHVEAMTGVRFEEYRIDRYLKAKFLHLNPESDMRISSVQEWQHFCDDVDERNVLILRNFTREITARSTYLQKKSLELKTQYIDMKPSKGAPATRQLLVVELEPESTEKNAMASKLCKRPVYGQVDVGYASKEVSMFGGPRMLDCTLEFIETVIANKKSSKKQAAPVALSEAEFKQMHSMMQESLNGFEQKISSSAETPEQLAVGAVIPPASGKELHDLAIEVLGHSCPDRIQKLEARLVEPTQA